MCSCSNPNKSLFDTLLFSDNMIQFEDDFFFEEDTM